MFSNLSQIFPKYQLLRNQNENIAQEPFLNMLNPQNFPGTLQVSMPIYSNRVQLSSGDSRMMFIFVKFVHSINQRNISQVAKNVSTHHTRSIPSQSRYNYGYKSMFPCCLNFVLILSHVSNMFPKSRIHELFYTTQSETLRY